jgi:superfamily II RNA helicase
MDDLAPHEQYVLDVLLNCAVDTVIHKDRNNVTATPGGVTPCAPGQKGTPLVVPVLLKTIEGISHIRIFLPKDLRQDQARETAWKSVLEVQRRFPDGIALLDPIQNMDIKDDRFKALVKVHSNPPKDPVFSKDTFVYPSRKSMSWNTKCFQVAYTRIPDYPNYTQCMLASKRAKRKYAR